MPFRNPNSVALEVTNEGFVLYEIKKGALPRTCVRKTLGQLCEYAKWPESPPVIDMVVVGRTPIDRYTEEYLVSLREHFALPIRFEHVSA